MEMVQFRTPECFVCGEASTVTVPHEGLTKWYAGLLIQQAFPTLSPAEREMLKTGIHSKCWDEMFSDNEDDLDPMDE